MATIGEATEIDRTALDALLHQAVESLRQGRPTEAERVCRRMLALDPRAANALNLIGIIAGLAGNHAEAIACFEQCSAWAPDETEFLANLVRVLSRVGRLEEAIAATRRALARKPRDWAIFELYRELRRSAGLGDLSHGEIFDFIYAGDHWQAGSGSGSLEAATREYRNFLQAFLRNNRIASVLDAGCGDWQFSRHIDWRGIAYLGIDVSPLILQRLEQFHAPNIGFARLDMVSETLPAADLLLAKDVLQHWSNESIHRFLPKLGSFRYALITNGFPAHRQGETNRDIPTGLIRPIDLTAPPFGLAGTYVFEFAADEVKRVLLWTREAGGIGPRAPS